MPLVPPHMVGRVTIDQSDSVVIWKVRFIASGNKSVLTPAAEAVNFNTSKLIQALTLHRRLL